MSSIAALIVPNDMNVIVGSHTVGRHTAVSCLCSSVSCWNPNTRARVSLNQATANMNYYGTCQVTLNSILIHEAKFGVSSNDNMHD